MQGLFRFFHGLIKKSRVNRFARIPNELMYLPEQITEIDDIAVYKSGWRACERGAYRSSPHNHHRYNFLWLLGFDERLNYEESLRLPHDINAPEYPEELYRNPEQHIPDGCVVLDVGSIYYNPITFEPMRNVYYEGPNGTDSIRIDTTHELWNWPDIL